MIFDLKIMTIITTIQTNQTLDNFKKSPNSFRVKQISYFFQHESECRAESAVDKTHYNDNKVRKRLQSKFEKIHNF